MALVSRARFVAFTGGVPSHEPLPNHSITLMRYEELDQRLTRL